MADDGLVGFSDADDILGSADAQAAAEDFERASEDFDFVKLDLSHGYLLVG